MPNVLRRERTRLSCGATHSAPASVTWSGCGPVGRAWTRAPRRSLASSTATERPACTNIAAAARPDTPAPTTTASTVVSALAFAARAAGRASAAAPVAAPATSVLRLIPRGSDPLSTRPPSFIPAFLSDSSHRRDSPGADPHAEQTLYRPSPTGAKYGRECQNRASMRVGRLAAAIVAIAASLVVA